MDFDLCPKCGLPTFNHEQIVVVSNEFIHRHCYEGSIRVTTYDMLHKQKIKN